MFNCQLCNKPQPPKTAPNNIVVESRKVVYNNKLWNKEKEEEYIKTTEGWEVVKELKVCERCYNV